MPKYDSKFILRVVKKIMTFSDNIHFNRDEKAYILKIYKEVTQYEFLEIVNLLATRDGIFERNSRLNSNYSKQVMEVVLFNADRV